jgi:hypothetical protein
LHVEETINSLAHFAMYALTNFPSGSIDTGVQNEICMRRYMGSAYVHYYNLPVCPVPVIGKGNPEVE